MAQKKTNVAALQAEMSVIQNKLNTLAEQKKLLNLKLQRLKKSYDDTVTKEQKLQHRLQELQARLGD